MTSSSAFSGFSVDAVRFFVDLAANNDKAWFEQNRATFEERVLAPARAYVEAIGARLRPLVPDIHADPRVDGSIFRLHRDTRFSPDKSPFKTHLGIFCWEGQRKKLECPGFYFHLEPPNVLLGVGIHIFPPPHLEAFRKAVVHPEQGLTLAAAIDDVTKAGPYDLWGEHYKRVPRGYDPEHPNARFLRFNGLTAGFETPIPPELHRADFVDYVFAHFRNMAPLHHWLADMVKRMLR